MNEALTVLYPTSDRDRAQWIVEQRPDRAIVDPNVPYAYLSEEECSPSGNRVSTSTIFLTNRECPWRCVMCDLWRNTLTGEVPVGSIPRQIEYALSRLGAAQQVKLYNSGSFFDRKAIPLEDYPAITSMVKNFDRVIVESHPSLVANGSLQFKSYLKNHLEVAMGLETVHPQVLEKLNKGMTLAQFATAAQYLSEHEIDLRVFILVQPPFMKAEDSLHWARRSLDFAFEHGATAATLIPTRGGNGAMERLAEGNLFTPPKLETVEAAFEYGIGLGKGRVFVDLWDIARLNVCNDCFLPRTERLREMNLSQRFPERIHCAGCGGLS